MDQPQFEGLYIPGEFTHIDNDAGSCIHPKENLGNRDFFIDIAKCGNIKSPQWQCSKCLASTHNISKAKKYFRIKRIKELE